MTMNAGGPAPSGPSLVITGPPAPPGNGVGVERAASEPHARGTSPTPPESVAVGNVGKSPAEAEAILAAIGVQRSPLVSSIRQAQRDRAPEVIQHIILVPLIEEGLP